MRLGKLQKLLKSIKSQGVSAPLHFIINWLEQLPYYTQVKSTVPYLSKCWEMGVLYPNSSRPPSLPRQFAKLPWGGTMSYCMEGLVSESSGEDLLAGWACVSISVTTPITAGMMASSRFVLKIDNISIVYFTMWPRMLHNHVFPFFSLHICCRLFCFWGKLFYHTLCYHQRRR